MTTITTRSGKGSPLTNDEVDANFTNLNTDKVETSGDSMTGNLSFGDNNKVILGSGNDLQLYHDGTDSLIKDKGQGDLRLTSNGSGIRLLNDNETEEMANFQLNGAVTLYHDNSPKLATTSTGIQVTGNISNASGNLTLDVAGETVIDSGSSGILRLKVSGTDYGMFFHDNTHMYVQSNISDGDMIFRGNDGGSTITALTLNMSEAGEATFNSDILLGDGKVARFGTDQDFRIGFDGSAATLQNVTSDSDILFKGNDGGSTITALTLDMSNGGRADFNNDIGLNDGRVLRLGNGDDTSIYNDGSHFNIVNTTSNQDMFFKGNDDGVNITALTLDMSAAGAATFNAGATFASNVGIGTDSPAKLLETVATGAGSDITALQVRNNSSNTSTSTSIRFVNSTVNTSTAGGAEVSAIRNANDGGSLTFKTAANSTATLTERMRLSSNGDISFYEDTGTTAKLFWDASAESLGIGTSSPDNKFVVSDAGGAGLEFIPQTSNDRTTLLSYDRNANAYQTIDLDALDVHFNTSGAERMRLDGNGNLLVGKTAADNTTAGTRIHPAGYASFTIPNDYPIIANRLSSDGDIAVFRKDNTTIGSIGTDNGSLTVSSSASGKTGLYFASGGLLPMNSGALDGSDQVNIGSSSYQFKDLYLSGTAHTNQLRLKDGTATTSGLFHEKDVVGSGTSTNPSFFAETGKSINFMVNGSVTKAAILDASGNLLVGQTSNSETGTGIGLVPDGTSHMYSASTDALMLGRGGSDGDILSFNKSGTSVGSIGVSGGNNLFISGQAANHAGLTFATDAILPTRQGSLTDNVTDLGASSERFVDIYATNGTIQTSDRNEKQDIEALSDAEQRVAVACKGLLRKFRWKSSVAENGDDARIHFGIIAQDLQDAFTAEGLDAGRYAMFTSTTWTDEETGEERTRMGVRYSELLAFIIATI